VFRFLKPMLAAGAIVGLVAAGCGGSSGTPTPPPISDPNEIITRSLEELTKSTSMHVRITVDGELDLSGLGDSAGGLAGKINLSGTYVEGDIDITNEALDFKFGVPALLALSGRIIVVDGYSYTQISLQGDKYTKSEAGDNLPVDLPSPEASASGEIAAQIEELKKQLDEAGIEATLEGDAKVDGKDCYHISIKIPAEKLSELMGEVDSTAAGVQIEDAQFDYYVYKESLRPAKISASGKAAGTGQASFELIVTKYDQSVDIKAPDPSQIQEDTGS
jgi:hypothetical protein